MRVLLLLLLSIIPSVVLFSYFYSKDKLEKEPRRMIIYAFILGILSIIPAIILELFLGAGPNDGSAQSVGFLFYEAFIAVALVEEGIKFLFVRFWASKRKDFNEFYDGILYAIVISLGFATLENILYVLEGGIGVAIIRAIFTVPMHAIGSVFIGYYIAKQKFKIDDEKYMMAKAIIYPVLLHGTFNFLLSTGSILIVLILPLMAAYIFAAYKLYQKVKQQYPRFAYLARPEVATKLHLDQTQIANAPLSQTVREITPPTPVKKNYTWAWVLLILFTIGVVGFVLLIILGIMLSNEPTNIQNIDTSLIEILK